MSIFEKYVPAATAFLASGYNPDMEPAILKRCLYILLELSEEGQRLEAENASLQERVQELEKAMTKLVKIEVPLPECAVCWERDKCTDHAHGDNCLAIGYIIDTAMEAAKEAGK